MIDWHQIDTVLLDMDGTLLDLHFDSHFWLEHLPQRYAQLHRLDQNAARDYIIPRIMAEKGTLNWYSLDYWSDQFGVDILALKREVQHLIGFRSDALNFLQWLKQADPKVILATNADRPGLALKLEATGLTEYLDEIVSSADLGLPKEDPVFWHALNQRSPFKPQRTLLIDDNEQVLNSARHYGIQWLLTIAQPDSRSPERTLTEYPAIDQFYHLTQS
ncbi:haloacid dehalogenase [Terasakiispira papahanaumokuakeensis]|uniref:Haloacid dehalogenase n=1 Tax=Terasakiispira papahanaumokuakeensis TaxID=197479 RepID=A0A1E2V674_9GAMM|nr:GMP/IMP nucleotidase [Terasakiispira papahanaumokuakeensis]ODC02510.1 haloacid dehalogenase [Terasakiispira papahanaumokuakeensis]